MNTISIEDAIKGTIEALKAGIPPPLIRYYLIQDGIEPKKSTIILRWANLTIQRTNINGQTSMDPQTSKSFSR